MDKSLRVVYPRDSGPFMLHSLLQNTNLALEWLSMTTNTIVAINGSIIDSEYEVSVPLLLESDHHKRSSRKAFWLEL